MLNCCHCPPNELLLRLFGQETVRLFATRAVAYHCPKDWGKVRLIPRSLGRCEVYAALPEHGEVVIKDDICNREYRLDAQATDELLCDPPSDTSPTVHEQRNQPTRRGAPEIAKRCRTGVRLIAGIISIPSGFLQRRFLACQVPGSVFRAGVVSGLSARLP
ncbi:Hsp33 family molecular chaperone HslO [Accumulibacter sp.]|uniref:Hsp33 family molecular chaperone HslO n=1 Tax=Accumulibacter sp. TaxID=2053492 RepID=UPI00391B4BAC